MRRRCPGPRRLGGRVRAEALQGGRSARRESELAIARRVRPKPYTLGGLASPTGDARAPPRGSGCTMRVPPRAARTALSFDRCADKTRAVCSLFFALGVRSGARAAEQVEWRHHACPGFAVTPGVCQAFGKAIAGPVSVRVRRAARTLAFARRPAVARCICPITDCWSAGSRVRRLLRQHACPGSRRLRRFYDGPVSGLMRWLSGVFVGARACDTP